MSDSDEPWPILPYGTDDYNAGDKQHTTFVGGKRFRVTTSHVRGSHHALALFAPDNNDPDDGYDSAVGWSPGKRSEVGQTASAGFYYENWEGRMERDEGHPFVQIDLPNHTTLNKYVFWFNTRSKNGVFNGDNHQPPQRWFVVGRKDNDDWKLLDQSNAGESSWRDDRWGNHDELKNGRKEFTVLDGGPYTSFRFVFMHWNGSGDKDVLRLDRIRMDVTEGRSTRTGAEDDDSDDDDSDEDPPVDPCVAEYGKKWGDISAACRDKCEFGSKSKSDLSPACRKHHTSWWMEEYRMYLIGAAVLVLLIVIYYVMNQ